MTRKKQNKNKKRKLPERLTLDSIDVESDEELDALMAQVLAEGDKIYAAQHAEAVRLGIVDEQGRLLKTSWPPEHLPGSHEPEREP
jgi:hypothetical protein